MRLIIILFITMTLAGCQKVIHISLASAPTQIVVEGYIETNLPPYVILTSTVGFFSNINLSTLQSSFIHGANVTVSNGSKTVTLREYTIDTTGGNKIYVYSVDTTNPANIMLGQVDSFYTLSITCNGKTYTSLTKIPSGNGLDTLWFAAPIFKDSKTPDSALQLFCNYTDPDTPGNYAQYYTKRNSQQFYQSGLYSDALVQGEVVKNIDLFAGYDDSLHANGDSLSYFYPGDTVTVKWCAIDKGVYNFWSSYIYAGSALGDPFASPINLQTNMTNGALGIWSGLGSVYYTLVVPH